MTGWRRSEAPKTRWGYTQLHSTLRLKSAPPLFVLPVSSMAVAIDNTSATANRLFIGLLDDVELGEGVEERRAEPPEPPTIGEQVPCHAETRVFGGKLAGPLHMASAASAHLCAQGLCGLSAWGRCKRTVGAIAAGLFFIIGVTTLVDLVLHATGVFPPMDQPIQRRARAAGDRLSHRHLRRRRVAHGAARAERADEARHDPGYVGVVLGLVGVLATWNLGLGPRWYPHPARRPGDPGMLGRRERSTKCRRARANMAPIIPDPRRSRAFAPRRPSRSGWRRTMPARPRSG